LNFTDVEKRLVCGDSKEQKGMPWASIPTNQAQFQMRSLLQTRGYLTPQFSTDTENQKLLVTPGEVTRIHSIILNNSPIVIDVSKRRGLLGAPLTPDHLNDLENWIDLKLRTSGYPCPAVKSLADQKTGEVVVEINSGPFEHIGSIDVNDNLGLQPQVLRRYDAFSMGDIFNEQNLILTERRILADNIVNTTHFTGECGANNLAHIHQHVNGGPPRTLKFGIGVDTEQFILTRVSWHHNRLDNNASLFGITIQAGYLTQSLSTDLKWFTFTDPRQYVRPNFSISRDKEVSQETNSLVTGIPWGKTLENPDRGLLVELGPVLRFDNTVVGLDMGSTHSLLLSGQANLTSHNFEYFASSPRTGYKLSLTGDFSNQAFISSATAQRLGLTTEFLWNLNSYDPPAVVLGWRSGGSFTFTGDTVADPQLAVNFKNFLGGSTDLRGFNRQELPSNSLGALSSLFTSFEIRFASLLPYQIQPFTFIDAGQLGYISENLDSTLYWSPGFGIRWDSPVGVFRTTLAHGFVSSNNGFDQSKSHWQFFLSYGEEF
jgi:translocation and assembly module TamA